MSDPAHIPLVDLQAQHAALRPELDAALARVLDSGRFIGGAEVAAFEAAFAAYQGSAHAVGVAATAVLLRRELRLVPVGNLSLWN